jgi:Uncharacterized protein conserved in bacteria
MPRRSSRIEKELPDTADQPKVIIIAGHSIPEETIRRRFVSGWDNFVRLYRDLADSWVVFDNAARVAVPIESSE